jgi:flagellar biosynthesis/type III secretory pathway chaperone
MNVTGLSIENILQMNITKLNEKELRQITTRLISASNKRIKRMQKAGNISPVVKRQTERGKFSIANDKNIYDVRETFKQVKNFLQTPSSTLTGWKKQKKLLAQQLEKMGIVTHKETDWGEVFALYDKLEEINPTLSEYKYKIAEQIEEFQHQNLSDIDIIHLIIDDYEKAEKENDIDEIFQFFNE